MLSVQNQQKYPAMRDQDGRLAGWDLPRDHFETNISNLFEHVLEEFPEVKYPQSYQATFGGTPGIVHMNGAYNNSNSSKRVCFDDKRPSAEDHREFSNQQVSVHDRLGSKTSVHNRLGGKASVHDQLGGRVNEESNNRLEEMAGSLVPDEDIMCKAPERRRTLQLDDEGSSQTRKKLNPQWCPDGLTKSQKRRVQHLRQLEQNEEVERHVLIKKKVRSKVWHPKHKADDGEDDKPQANINMVVFLPKEFMDPIDSDVSDEELGMAQLTLEPKQAIFEKPEDGKRQHLKALFLKGFVNRKPITRMLLDGGVAVNLMSYTMLRKIGKFDEDLTQTDMMLVDFEGNVSPAQGAICAGLTISSKTLSTAFFVIKGRGSYNLLLGRDWIHANCCIPSTMHHPMDQRFSGGGSRRNLLDSSSYRSTRMDL
jgi:hypothetical protein